MCKKESRNVKMAATIEKIISVETSDMDNFLKQQLKRKKQLFETEKRKNNGCHVRTNRIIAKLQRAGILDENGELAAPYNGED